MPCKNANSIVEIIEGYPILGPRGHSNARGKMMKPLSIYETHNEYGRVMGSKEKDLLKIPGHPWPFSRLAFRPAVVGLLLPPLGEDYKA